ncbi:hypothetical protein HQ560_10140 [bacterium]|nr:hypothetical protein [bacterium]
MRCSGFCLILLMAATLVFPGTPPGRDGKDAFLIDPAKRVGRITPTSTEKQLIAIYGAPNVRRGKIHVGEGETVEGTVLFPGIPNKVEIEWKQAFGHPKRISIGTAGARWRTKEGITVGTTLKKLEAANGFPFRLAGFSWDYEGRVLSWGKGRLPAQLVVDLRPTRKVSKAVSRAVDGAGEFSSGHPSMQKMGLVVATLFILWE